MRRATAVILCPLALLTAAPALAQEVLIAADLRVGPVPPTPGTGVPARWVRGHFPGFPFHIDDARDLLDGTAVLPAFDLWCGALPYIDLGNRSTNDSLGRGAPVMLCAPFLSATESSEFTCRALPAVPRGRYWRNGGAALRARGGLAVRAPGVYTFAWGHDDGVSFRIGATRVYEFADGTGPRVDVARVRFEAAGLYPFVLEWFDGIGGAVIDWYVSPGVRTAEEFSNFTFALVPTEDLYALDARECTARCEPCALPTPLCDRAAGRCVRCLDDAACGPCAVCREGACVAAPATGSCAPDAGSLDASVPRDAAADAEVDAGTPPADLGVDGGEGLPRASGGCACGVAMASRRAGSLASLGVLVVGWSRRRRRRRR
jgi:hypothetical protein